MPTASTILRPPSGGCDPEGGPVLRGLLDELGVAIPDDEMIRQIPLRVLATFGAVPGGPEAVDALVARVNG